MIVFRRVRCSLCFLLLPVLMPVACAAENLRSDISGIVTIEQSDDSRISPAGMTVNLYEDRKSAELGSGGIFTTVAESGKFQFAKVYPGTYYLRISSVGFEIGGKFQHYVLPQESLEIVVTDGGAVSGPPEFHVQLGATITGRVLKLDKQPIESAIVRITTAQTRASYSREGFFVVKGVPASGQTQLVITPAKPPEYGYLQTVDITADKLAAEKTFDVGVISFAPLPEKPNFVGTAQSPDGEPLSGVKTFILVQCDGSVQIPLRINEGEFKASAFPGRYKVAKFRLDGQHDAFDEIEIRAGHVTEIRLVVPVEN